MSLSRLAVRSITAINPKISQQFRAMGLKPVSSDWATDKKKFTWAGMKKNPAVLPLVFILGTTITGLITFIGYCALTRPDVNIRRKEDSPNAEKLIDVKNPRPLKLFTFQQEYVPNVELNEALKYREEEAALTAKK